MSQLGARVVAGLGLLLAGVIYASPAVADDAAKQGPEIVVKVAVAREVVVKAADGSEKVELREVTSAGPGDTLVYSITYTNKGTEAARNTRIVDPVPSGTRVIPGAWTAPGAELSVSVDGGRTFQPYPVRHSVTTDDGRIVVKEVEPERYTHLRWTALEPLPPSETRTATFKVEVR